MATRIAKAMASALIAVLYLAGGSAAAQQKPVDFLGAGSDGNLTQKVGTVVDVQLPFSVADKRNLELYLSPFSGEHGDAVSLQQSIVEMPKLQPTAGRLFFTTDPGVLTLRLQGPALATAGNYTGSLAVLEDGKLAQSLRIQLTRAPAPRPAKLVVEPKAVNVYQRLWPDSEGSFSFQLRNTGADWPAEGVFLRAVELTTPAGTNFDPARYLKLTWNGQPADDLWRSPSAGGLARTIAPNQQAEIGGRITGLSAGEYSLKIGVGAGNATVEPDQQVNIRAYVKHRWVYALGALLLAIAISYVMTKGLELRRRYVAQLEKVASIRPSWLQDEPAALPAVAARALLTQVEDRNESWRKAFLTQDVNKARIDKAELLLKILKKVFSIQSGRKSWNLMITNRFNKQLAGVVGRLDPQTVNEDEVRKMDAELGVLEQWSDPSKLPELYWLALKGDMEILLAEIRLDAFTQHQQLLKDLHREVKKKLEKPAAGKSAYEVEESYAKLKIFWERQKEKDADALKTLGDGLAKNPRMRIEEFFELADGIAWSQLKTVALEFIKPAKNEVDPLHAYDLVRFQVAPANDSQVGRTYLFKHAVEYIWSVELQELGAAHKKPLNTRRTKEPRLVHYCPQAGTLYVSVRLRYKDDECDKGSDTWTVQGSRDDRWLNASRINDITALGIATGLATLSGMGAYYASKPAFGWIDYIALIAWGVGVDQAKNFVQILDKTSGKG